MTLSELKTKVDELYEKYDHLADLVETDIDDLEVLQPTGTGQPCAIRVGIDHKTRYVLDGRQAAQ